MNRASQAALDTTNLFHGIFETILAELLMLDVFKFIAQPTLAGIAASRIIELINEDTWGGLSAVCNSSSFSHSNVCLLCVPTSNQ